MFHNFFFFFPFSSKINIPITYDITLKWNTQLFCGYLSEHCWQDYNACVNVLPLFLPVHPLFCPLLTENSKNSRHLLCKCLDICSAMCCRQSTAGPILLKQHFCTFQVNPVVADKPYQVRGFTLQGHARTLVLVAWGLVHTEPEKCVNNTHFLLSFGLLDAQRVCFSPQTEGFVLCIYFQTETVVITWILSVNRRCFLKH
jgi:hypothetical protein